MLFPKNIRPRTTLVFEEKNNAATNCDSAQMRSCYMYVFVFFVLTKKKCSHTRLFSCGQRDFHEWSPSQTFAVKHEMSRGAEIGVFFAAHSRWSFASQRQEYWYLLCFLPRPGQEHQFIELLNCRTVQETRTDKEKKKRNIHHVCTTVVAVLDMSCWPLQTQILQNDNNSNDDWTTPKVGPVSTLRLGSLSGFLGP